METLSAYIPLMNSSTVLPISMRVPNPNILFIVLSAMVTSGDVFPDLFSSDMKDIVTSSNRCIHPSVRLPLSVQSDDALGMIMMGESSQFKGVNILIRNSFFGR